MTVKPYQYLLFCLAFIAVLVTVMDLGRSHTPTPTSTPMPTWVDVNGIIWRIDQVDRIGQQNSNIVGYTMCNVRKILVDVHAPSKRETLMHELSHATVCTDAGFEFKSNNMYYNSTTAEEHESIYRFTAVWSEILQRNPDLADYLKEKE